MERKTPKKVDRKRFVRYKEGAEMYSMCQSKFEGMAKDAGAIYKLNKLVLVNCDIFELFLVANDVIRQKLYHRRGIFSTDTFAFPVTL